MRFVITSGGTKVPIDSVRSITNMSNGTFGSQIAERFHDEIDPESTRDCVNFIFAKNSKVPNDIQASYSPQFITEQYETFSDYHDTLMDAITSPFFMGNTELVHPPDIIVLAAAVSDYIVTTPVAGKIRSAEDLSITLTPAPKIISDIRDACPNAVICGFKLLVGSTPDELIAAAKDSIQKNRIDLVIANDLSTIRNDDHSLFVVEKDWHKEFRRSEHNLATVVRDFCMIHYYRKAQS